MSFGNVRALVVLVVGVVILFMSVQSWSTTIDFLNHALPSQATVSGNVREVDSKGNVSYCPLLTFRTQTGHRVSSEGQNICQDTPFIIGRQMTIHYRSDQPTTTEVDGFEGTWMPPLMLTALSLVLVGGSLIFMRYKWRKAHPRPGRVARAAAKAGMASPWPLPEDQALGERYIEALLQQQTHEAATAQGVAAAVRVADLTTAPTERTAATPREHLLTLYRQGDYWAAMDELRRLVAAHVDDQITERLGVLELFPGLWSLPHARSTYRLVGGVLASVLGDAEAVIDEWRQSIELEPDYAPVHAALGDAYRMKGDLNAARQEYLRAVSLDATLAPALHGLALLFAARHDYHKAQEYAQRAVAAAPTNSLYQSTRNSVVAQVAAK